MFDIGMLEIGLIAVVALLVIGPERLPAVARTVGYWFGKTRSFIVSVQQDFHRELDKSEELKKLMEEQSKIKDVHEIIEQTVDETRKSVSVGANLTPPLDVLPDKEDEDSVESETGKSTNRDQKAEIEDKAPQDKQSQQS